MPILGKKSLRCICCHIVIQCRIFAIGNSIKKRSVRWKQQKNTTIVVTNRDFIYELKEYIKHLLHSLHDKIYSYHTESYIYYNIQLSSCTKGEGAIDCFILLLLLLLLLLVCILSSPELYWNAHLSENVWFFSHLLQNLRKTQHIIFKLMIKSKQRKHIHLTFKNLFTITTTSLSTKLHYVTFHQATLRHFPPNYKYNKSLGRGFKICSNKRQLFSRLYWTYMRSSPNSI